MARTLVGGGGVLVWFGGINRKMGGGKGGWEERR